MLAKDTTAQFETNTENCLKTLLNSKNVSVLTSGNLLYKSFRKKCI